MVVVKSTTLEPANALFIDVPVNQSGNHMTGPRGSDGRRRFEPGTDGIRGGTVARGVWPR